MKALWLYLRRLGHVGLVVGRYGLVNGVGGILRRVPGLAARLAPRPPGPERLRQLLEDLGGTFIKFGQVLALQPDVLPREYCDALFDLMDRVPPFDYAGVEAVFESELGRVPDEIFDSFEREPVASASIGQVHVAHLDGRKLAVKVQRPTAERDFGADLRLLRFVATWIRRLRLTRLDWITVPIGDFVTWTSEELDYALEARFMDRLAANATDRQRQRIPEVSWELSSRRILTAEYLEGVTLLEYLRATQTRDRELLERLEKNGFDPDRFAENVLRNFLDDVLEHGVFHADLHPANLMILPGNAVGYVDFGITGVISGHSRVQVMAAILALVRGDLDGLYRALLKMSNVDDESDLEAYRQRLRELSEEWLERRDGRVRMRTSYSVFSLDLLQLTRSTHVLPHPEVVRYIRSVVTCDGLIRRFAPGVDIDARLEEFSSDLLGSRKLSTAFSVENFVDWWAASGRLLRDGAARLDLYLDRAWERGDESSSAPASARVRPGAEPGQTLLRTAVALVVPALLMVLFREPARLGLNLFTAEAALVAAGLALLLTRTMRWLASSS